MSKVVEQIEENLKKLKKLGFSETELVERYESKILSLKNGELSYVFIKNIKGADVMAHGQVIIESKDSRFKDWFKEDFEDEYKILKSNNFIDDALDEMIKENNEENKSMQKRS